MHLERICHVIVHTCLAWLVYPDDFRSHFVNKCVQMPRRTVSYRGNYTSSSASNAEKDKHL